MDSEVDYRTLQYELETSDKGKKVRSLASETFFHPLNADTRKKMDELFLFFTDGHSA